MRFVRIENKKINSDNRIIGKTIIYTQHAIIILFTQNKKNKLYILNSYEIIFYYYHLPVGYKNYKLLLLIKKITSIYYSVIIYYYLYIIIYNMLFFKIIFISNLFNKY